MSRLFALILLALIAGSAIALAQNETRIGRPADFEPIHPVAASETHIALFNFPAAALPGLAQLQRRPTRDVLREYWRWDTGAMAIASATAPNTTIGKGRNDPAGLVAQFVFWRELVERGIAFERDDIKRGENRIGPYFFAVSDRTIDGETCLFFRQGLPVKIVGSVTKDDDAVRGEISGYDCRTGDRLTPNGLEILVRPMIDALAIR
ncbi:MAG: hypothetical protein O7C63_08475 [Alphaproteobacteria bacterium]|nr:hypothetical protein [Alphaproteobacteria bacterium]